MASCGTLTGGIVRADHGPIDIRIVRTLPGSGKAEKENHDSFLEKHYLRDGVVECIENL